MADNSKFVPPKGMRDWLPQEVLLRQKLIRLIESHYQLYGFQPIDTPVMENIEVLQGKGGGENEKLMFKIMKRGEELSEIIEEINRHLIDVKQNVSSTLTDEDIDRLKSIKVSDLEKNLLNKSKSVTSEDMAQSSEQFKNRIPDMGLRFDMTVPLARYYGNHTNDLPKPFRCYHIGPVWRADRPQKGRFREFYQCDIDIVGGVSDDYEVELLLATDRVLKALNFGKFKIRISHKQLLFVLLKSFGAEDSVVGKIAVAIDKLDKQSLEAVVKEIGFLGLPTSTQTKVEEFLKDAKSGSFDLKKYLPVEGEPLAQQIDSIRQRVHEINSGANVVFDALLVRGFDYYTGPVFEINVEDKDFTFSIGGGGRYDGLIEKLGGPKNTPAVGLSLGFERILLLLAERNKTKYQNVSSVVYLVNKYKHTKEKDILAFAEILRSNGVQVEACLEKKDYGSQMKAAEERGIQYSVEEFNVDTESKPDFTKFIVKHLPTRKSEQMTIDQLKDALIKAAGSTML